jgi:hypothetical protein
MPPLDRSVREHFGRGQLAFEPAQAVFINCPFDDSYQPTFDAIVWFNMPLELGIAMARRFMPEPGADQHDWLILAPEGHLYLRFASDLAGFDPRCYDGKPDSVVREVMTWLLTRREARYRLTPREVLRELPRFQDAKAQLCQDWGGSPPWADLVLTALDISRPLLQAGS